MCDQHCHKHVIVISLSGLAHYCIALRRVPKDQMTLYICAVWQDPALLIYTKETCRKLHVCCHQIAANSCLKNGFTHMLPCYPRICICTDPVYKNKLTQIAIFVMFIASKMIIMINWDRIKVAFSKKKSKFAFSKKNT